METNYGCSCHGDILAMGPRIMNWIFKGDKLVRALLIAVLFFVAQGCVSSTAGVSISNELSDARYCVELQSKDARKLSDTIAERISYTGRKAVSAQDCSYRDTDYVVTYIDRWQWDMRMYMSALRIEIRRRNEDSLVGYGESQQSSLAATGDSFEDVIDRALGEIFGPKAR